MGLDMNLYRVTDMGDYEVTIKRTDGKECHVKPERIESVRENVAYWRKAYHIDRWFVRHLKGVENCEDAYVSREDLQKLLEDCRAVVDDRSKAKTIFDTEEFDDVDYGQTGATVAMLETILAEPGDGEFYYVQNY